MAEGLDIYRSDVKLPNDVGFVDHCMSGWFQGVELYKDFPIVRDDVVVDAGCGNGGYAAFAGKQGAHVVLCDLLPEKVASTAKLVRASGAREVTEVVTSSDRLPLPDALATKVICTEVLEHVDDPAFFVSELVRIAKPGALFALTVPHPASEGIQARVAPEWYFRKPHHLRVFQTEQFNKLVTGAGLEVIRHDWFGFYTTIFLALFRVCDTTLEERDHPLLRAWAKTWRMVLEMEGGPELKAKLDEALPVSQIIIARKPG